MFKTLTRTAPFASLFSVLDFAIPATVLVLFFWEQVKDGQVFFVEWAGDIFIPLEGVLHLERGEQPHLDFPTPIGTLYYLVHYATTWFAPLSARTIVYANAVVAGLVAALTVLTMRTRVPAITCAVSALYLAFVAASPRQLGEYYQKISYNGSYNRFGWAIIGLLSLVLFLPSPARSREGARLDGVIAGLLLFVLFYMKASYFLVGVGLAGLAVLTVRRHLWSPFAGALALSWLGAMLTMEIATGATLAYVADLRTAAASQIDPIRRGQFLYMAIAALPGLATVAVLALIANWLRAAAVASWETIVCPLAIVAAGVALGTQNHIALENPLVPVAAVVAWYAWRSPIASEEPVSGKRLLGRGVPELAGQVALALLFAQPMLLDAASAAWTRSPAVDRDSALAWLRDTPLGDLRLHVDDNRFAEIPSPTSSPLEIIKTEVEYFYVIEDGYRLLQRHDVRNGTVFAMAWTNPFPTLLGLPPARHNLPWWDPGRTFTATVKPDPARLFADVSYVVIPKAYVNYYATKAMREVYDDYINAHFQRADETRFWVLLARRDASAAEPSR